MIRIRIQSLVLSADMKKSAPLAAHPQLAADWLLHRTKETTVRQNVTDARWEIRIMKYVLGVFYFLPHHPQILSGLSIDANWA